MSSTSDSGIAFACAYREQGLRPRSVALPTLDPTQRPSAPLRWAA